LNAPCARSKLRGIDPYAQHSGEFLFAPIDGDARDQRPDADVASTWTAQSVGGLD
jgi:hypothetical protein